MAIEDFGLSDAGFTAPRTSDWLTAIRDRLDALYIEQGYMVTPDYERDDFHGNITLVMAELLGAQSEATQAVYDARSLANATGLQLANLALLVGVPRDPATFSTAIVTLGGTDGTLIVAGKRVQIGTSGAIWITQDPVTISGGTATVTVQAEDAGEILAAPGAIDTIVTPVSGWTSVTNAAAADPGSDRESDAELRVRRQRAIQAAGAGNTNAILAALLNLDFVTGATVIDNKTENDEVISGITVPAYGLHAVVAPDSMSTAEQETVAETIYSKLNPGTATGGSSSADVTRLDEQVETINFTLATDTPVTVAFTLTLDAGYVVADVEEPLEELVTDFFLTLSTGGTVYPTPLIALAATVDGVLNVTQLLLNGGTSPVTHDADEQPTLGTFSAA